MTVQADQAAGVHDYNGQRYYFCSAACVEEFKQAPDKYVSKHDPKLQQNDRMTVSSGTLVIAPGDEDRFG
jgi:YHS domain-containing protein